MNHIYKSIFNKALGVFTAVPEFASAHGKGSERTVVGRVAKGTAGFAASALAISVGLALTSTNAVASAGIYVNDGTDGGCLALPDSPSPNTGIYGIVGNNISVPNSMVKPGHTLPANSYLGLDHMNPCRPVGDAVHAAATQTNRTLFYGNTHTVDTTNNGAKNLTLGGRLDVNSGIIGVGDRGTNGAGATNSIRMGTGTTLDEANKVANSISIGVDTGASAVGSTAIGANAKARADYSVALGDSAVSGDNTVGAVNGGGGAIAIGRQSMANNYNAIAIGMSASVSPAAGVTTASDGIAIGSETVVDNYKGIAVGAYSQAKGRQSTVIANNVQGSNYSTASGTRSQVYGAETNVSGNNSVAIGDTNTVASDRTYVMGNNINAPAGTQNSLAFGTRASVGGASSITMGLDSKTNTDGSIAMGLYSEAGGPITNGKPGINATAIGTEAKALGLSAVAMGYRATVENGHDSIAIGVAAKSTNKKSTAIGTLSEASGEQSTVISNNYDAKGGQSISIASGRRSQIYGSETTVSGEQSVAIGDTNNVASARTYAMGNNINVAAGADDSLAFGTKANVGGVSSIAMGNTAQATSNYATAIGGDALAHGSDGALAVGRKATANADSGAMAIGYDAIATGKSGIAQGYHAHTNAQSGLAIGDNAKASGIGQVAIGYASNAQKADIDKDATAATNKADYSVTVGHYAGADYTGTNNIRSTLVGDSAGRYGEEGNQNTAIGSLAGMYVKGSNNVALGIGAGSGAAAAKLEASETVAIGHDSRAFSDYSTAIGSKAKARGVNSIAMGSTANSSAENAIAVGNGAAAANANSVALGAGSATSAAHATGPYTLNGSYTAAGLPVAANGTVSVGAAGKERQIQNVAAGVISATSTDAINGSQLYATNNYMNNFAGDVKTKLGGNAALANDGHLTMTNIGGTGKDNINDAIAAANTKVAAGKNITVTPTTNADGSKTYTVATTKDLIVDSVKAGDSTLNTDGLTIAGGPSVKKDGINAGDKKITGVADGNVAAGSKEAVNGGQLAEVKAKADSAVQNVVSTNPTALTATKAGDTVTLTPNFIAGDLVNPATGAVNTPAAGDAGKLVTAGTVANALANTHFVVDTAKTDGELDAASKHDQKIKSGNKVTLQAGKNLKAKQTNAADGATVEFSLKDSISLTQVTAGTGANQVVLGNDGVQVGGNTYINKDGLNANNKPISNVADGVKPKDAVNKGQLDAVAQEAAKHTTVKAGQNVEVTEANNAAGGKEYTVKTADNLNVTSVKAGDSTLNTDGLTIAGGPSVKKDGINAGDKKITNVAPGTVAAGSKDAVNGGQLAEVKAKADSAVQNVVSTNPTALTANKVGDTVTLTPNFIAGDLVNADGTVKDPAAADEGKLVSAKTVADALKANHFVVDTKANGGTVDAASEENAKVGSGNKVTFEAGKNLVAQQTNTANGGATVNYKLSDTLENLVSVKSAEIEAGIGPNKVVLNNNGVKVGDSTLNDKGLTINNGPSVTDAGIDAGNKKITGVADGNVAAGSTDAVNGGQLAEVKAKADSAVQDVKSGDENALTAVKDPNTNIVTVTPKLSGDLVDANGNITAPTTPADKGKLVTAGTVAEALANTHFVVDTKATDGELDAASQADQKIKAGNKVTLQAGKNLKAKQTNGANGAQVEFSLKDSISLKEVTAGEGANQVVLGNDGVKVGGNTYINNAGLNANGNKITNVADGVDPTDAVNKSQLDAVKGVADSAVKSVDVANGEQNLVVDNSDPKNPKLSLKKDLTVDSVKAGDSTLNNDGLTIAGGPSVKKDGINAGDKTITNVAPGAVTPTSKDAVNGGQLYNVANNVKDLIGPDATIDPATGKVTVADPAKGIGETGKGNIGDAIKHVNDAAKAAAETAAKHTTVVEGKNVKVTKGKNAAGGDEYTVATKDDLDVTSVTAGNTTVNTNGLTITGGPSVTRGGIDAGNRVISGVKAGDVSATSQEAVNGSQLHATNTKLDGVKAKADTAVQDVKSGDENALTAVKDPNTNIVTVTPKLSGDLVDANGNITAPTTPADKGKLVTAGTVADALANTHFVVDTKATDGELDAASQADQKIKAGNKVTLQAGKNLKAKQTNGANGAQVEFSLKDSISLKEVTAGEGANQVVLGNDGVKVGGNTYINNAGLNANGNKITNVADGVDPTDAVNKSQLDAVKGVADSAVKSVDVANGEQNLVVDNSDPKNPKLSLKKDLTVDSVKAGDSTLNNDGLTIAGGPSVKKDGINAGDKTITNVAPGAVTPTSKDAVNGGQLYNVANNVKDLIGPDATIDPATGKVTVADPAKGIGETGKGNIGDAIKHVNDAAKAAADTAKKHTTVEQGDNILVEESLNADGGKHYKVSTARDLNVDSVKAGDTTVNNDGVTINNGPSMTKDGINANNTKVTNVADGVDAADAVNKGQLDKVDTKVSNVAQNVVNVLGGDATVNGNGDITMSNIGETGKGNINDAIKSVNDLAKKAAAEKTSVKAKEGRSNVTVTEGVNAAGGHEYTVDVERSVTNAGSDYVTVTNNHDADTNTTTYTVDVSAKTKASLAKADSAVQGLTSKDGNLNFTKGANGNVEVSFNDNLNVKNVTTDRVQVANGPSMSKDGINAAGKAISNVANGNVAADSKDAVNGGQLHETAKSVADVIGGGATVKDGKVVAGQNGIGNTGQNTVHGAIAAINQNTANNFNQIRGDLRKMDRDLRGGIAGALATAGLPQAFRPGKSMVAAAASTYRGQSGLAIGVSRISDNGKVILKVTGNTNSRGDFGGTIGAGYQW